MMHYNLSCEQWVPIPLERVFAFFADPHNLPRITPPELSLRIERLKLVAADPSHPTFAAAGSDVVVSFRVPIVGFRMQHMAHITGFEMNRFFRDQHSRWPLMDWDHRHEFELAEHDGITGTIVRDDLRYELGPGLLGAVLNALVVRRQLEKMFQFRRRALDQLVKAGALD
jgi:ligand-binding SRPBCC domain-containing protein